MKKLILLLLFFPLLASAQVEIDNDETDCLEGWLSMDVRVFVNGERFDFRPSCDFSFDTTFKTSQGEECVIEAGMCSGFGPEKTFDVRCERSGQFGILIYCPRKY